MDQAPTDRELIEREKPTAILRSITFSILSKADAEARKAIIVRAVNEVTDPALGLPNQINQCSTCGSKDRRECEGHFGLINFPVTILNPYFLPEIAQILNKICPACKSVKAKRSGSASLPERPNDCKYCYPGKLKDVYPPMKFKVSSKDIFGKTAITAEVNERSSSNIAADYWDFIPSDDQQDESSSSTRRVLSHAQVYQILKDVDLRFLESVLKRKNSIFLDSILLTPNCQRVTEFGQHIIFDSTTKYYKKLIDFRGSPNELSTRVQERIKASKVYTDKSAPVDYGINASGSNDSSAPTSGLKFIRELLMGKRTDHAFRMVVVGDPYIKLGEIGMPSHIAQKVQVAEQINKWNLDKLESYVPYWLFHGVDIRVRREGRIVKLTISDKLCCGDVLYRPMLDGDIVMINRPPSIHQHSILSLSVRTLPNNSVCSINPLICSPLRGDFDGDCLHGFVPQSVDARVELNELVAIDKQLCNGQSGRNLLSLSHDSLTAAHLILENGVTLTKFQMQQLQMFCPYEQQFPAIIKKLEKPTKEHTCFWTGQQLFSLLMPPGFNYDFPSNGVCITKGEIMTSSGASTWLHDVDGNLFHGLIQFCGEQVISILNAMQEVLCQWLSMRGLSVSLSDLYLASDAFCRENMIQEVFCGLQEAEILSDIELMMVDANKNFLAQCLEENTRVEDFGEDHISVQLNKSAALSQASVSAFKRVFSVIQHLAFQYASKHNSFIAMLKAGSKGNLQKLVQHSMCLGLQHSVAPLSFRMPRRLSCAAWNDHKISLCRSHGPLENNESYIPFAVVENSFLTGLNPLECFVHSLTNRDGSFSGHADVSGTLTRKLMFFMRDVCIAYDGTVRNSYGDQIVQFAYTRKISSPTGSNGFSGERAKANEVMGGHPVGSLAACAISEAAYSALDQPVSALESSPLLNLKKILDSGVKRSGGDKTATIFLSKKLAKLAHGFEYGALAVKDHLQRLKFGEIVSHAMIRSVQSSDSRNDDLVCFFRTHLVHVSMWNSYSQEICGLSHISPWICHFHVSKDVFKKKRLSLHSIIGALHATWRIMKVKVKSKLKSKLDLPDLQISTSARCPRTFKENEMVSEICIKVSLLDKYQNSSSQLDVIRDMVIHSLLGSVIKGFPEFKKVDILWKDCSKSQKFSKGSCSGLYLRVNMSENCDKGKFWSILVDSCIQIRNLIDWEHSHPDEIRDVTPAYGIDTAVNHFISSLHTAICDIGKTVLPEHLVLTADTLSTTGEFVALNAKGLTQQRKVTSVSSPFVQACFSSPADCFVKAAKAGAVDNLEGTVDALSWGMVPSVGTGARFEIVYPKKVYELEKPVEVYDFLLSSHASSNQEVTEKLPKKQYELSGKSLAQHLFAYRSKWNHLDMKLLLKGFLAPKDIQNLSQTLRNLLYKYEIDCYLNDVDKAVVMSALYFHPRGTEKIGTGALNIKVGYHSEYKDSRCFQLVRTDGTTEDFSYHKCVHHAFELIAPQKAKTYESKWLLHRETERGMADGPSSQA
ncbi:OLC1v1029529C3 [Oldenlandia corymbosa var. corymbosa]|nr:OLC1v1029529C3 [Oldenlandia corymbosa var. corymbosa]